MSEEDRKEKTGEISRRKFLKDAGFIVGGAAIGSTVLLAACAPTEPGAEKTVTKTVEVPGPTKTVTVEKTVEVPEKLTKLIVNGWPYELAVEPDWTLLYVLRDKLELTGTKAGCDQASCGACTVLREGKAVMSCSILAIECDGREFTTIEGLAQGEELHPVQEAFIEHMGFQCGFCTPGMIMSAKALLDTNSNPTEEAVKEALAGNLCRCAGYTQIFTSVLAAADKMRGGV